MAKKLGRGLSHLLNTGDDRSLPREDRHPEYQQIPINEIRPNPNQPRKRFDESEIRELSKTLHSVGLIEPVIVRRIDEGYQLIAGERRWRACSMAGFKKIPVIIKQLNDIQALELGIIENIQREDLNPIEEARAYEMLIEKTGMKPSQVGDKVGKDRTTVANLLRLLKLPEEILGYIEQGRITAGQSRPLLGLGDRTAMMRVTRKIIEQGWNARRVEEEVARLTESPGSGRKKRASVKGDANIRSIEEKVRKKFMARVRLDHTKKGSGSIAIHYGNLEDLDRILELMGIK